MKEEMRKAYKLGWGLLPLKPDSKEPNLPTGHPFLGRHPTNDEYKRFKWGNYGIVTGSVSGITVLDIDGAEGLRSLAKNEKLDVIGADTPQVITPNGRHIYFKHHLGVKTRIGFYPGVDIKSSGGYVVGPGSSVGGNYYVWDDVYGIDTPLDDVPYWMLEQPSRKDRIESWRIGDMIEDGKRNSTLISLAGTLVVRDLPGPVVLEMITVANSMMCKPPLGDDELTKIAKSAERYRTDD